MVRQLRMIAGLVALLAGGWIGCGDGGSGGGSGAAPPPASAIEPAQTANTAGASAQQTTTAATEAVLESGAPGSTSSTSSVSGSSAPTPTFNFQASVNVTVDLDMLNASGQDKYPNASGILTVSASGSVIGDPTAGQAAYAVDVAWVTDGVFTDPACGVTARVAAGSHLNYNLVVRWTYADALNWTIQATSDLDAAYTVTVTDASGPWTLSGTVVRHSSLTITRATGAFSVAVSVSGERTFVVSNGTETHTVDIRVESLDRIFITVDGVTYGPYTLAQILWYFRFNCQP